MFLKGGHLRSFAGGLAAYNGTVLGGFERYEWIENVTNEAQTYRDRTEQQRHRSSQLLRCIVYSHWISKLDDHLERHVYSSKSTLASYLSARQTIYTRLENSSLNASNFSALSHTFTLPWNIDQLKYRRNLLLYRKERRCALDDLSAW